MKLQTALAALLLATSSVLADFRFIHTSDTHVGVGSPNNVTDARLFKEISELTPKPAFVVLTGDTVEYGTDAEYEAFHKVTESLGGIPLHSAPGNHDVRWNPRGKEGYTKYGPGKGSLYHSWDYQNVHFVTLDSTVLLEHWGHISQEQLNWLKKDLEKVGTEKPVIIGFHHWVGRNGETVQVDNEQALLDLVAPYNVVLWLQGHGHSDIEWNANGVPAQMLKGLYQESYQVIDVTDTELKVYKRFMPDEKKAATRELTQDITRDKSVPQGRGPSTRPVFTASLKKRVAPVWSAEAKLAPDAKSITLTVTPPADGGATLSYRINTSKPVEISGNSATISTEGLTPGDHVVTVVATFPPPTPGASKAVQPVYQKPLPITLSGVTPAWSTNIGGEVQSRVIRHKDEKNDLLLVSSMGNDLIALGAADGKEKWRAKTNGPIFSACAVSNGTAYFGSDDHHVYAVDVSTGSLKWKTKTNGSVLAGPAVAKGIVCVGSADTKVYGLDAATGEVKWTVQGKNLFQSQTATDGEKFFVGSWDNHFRAIDASSGTLVWDLELGRKQRFLNFSAFAPAITAPAVGNGKVFVSTNDGILHAIQTSDGKEVWNVDWKKMGYSSPLFHNGKVFCALADEGKVFCANADTGALEWTTDTGSVIYDASFTHAGPKEAGVVSIANVNGTLNCLDATTGKITWKYRLGPGHLLGSPAGDTEKLYMGSMSGRVVALPITPPAS